MTKSAHLTTAPPLDRFMVLGVMTALMLQSPLHRNWYIHDIERHLIPRIRLGQFKLYTVEAGEKSDFCAFVTWAFLDEANHASMLETGELLANADLQNGKHLWFFDYVAPFGHTAFIINDLRNNMFSTHGRAYAIRRRADGTIRKIALWRQQPRHCA